MPDPASLTPGAVPLTDVPLRKAEINEDATAGDQMLKCRIGGWTTDFCPWNPVTTAAGEFWPKRGDRALVSVLADDPEVVVWWTPSAGATPDVPF